MTLVTAWKKGNKDAKYYIIFMSMHSVTLLILIALFLGVVEYNNFTRYAFIYASFIEMSFFSLVLANKFYVTKTEKKIVEITLKDTKELANRDALTNLYNRHYLKSYTIHSINEARSKGQELAVIMLYIDKFKAINDVFGHCVGDMILSNIAKILTSTIRKSDVVARYGGEEFIIILPNANVKNTQFIAEKIRINIENLKTKYEDGKDVSVTISLGISLLKTDDDAMEAIINRADKALYEAKNSGRNRMVII